MMTMQVFESAPSNIALIKYMGKESSSNLPMNPSLSYTLNHLRTYVRLTKDLKDSWKSLDGPEYWKLDMSEKSIKKYMDFFTFLKKEMNILGNYLVESANNFPADAGVASSASSFAALTLAASRLSPQKFSLEKLSSLSRQGSGSSCRSFFWPWSIWEGAEARSADIEIGQLLHLLIVVNVEKKIVSSSEAHQRVKTSHKLSGRKERALSRLNLLIPNLTKNNWQKAYEICLEETLDMHSLFESSNPAFSYMTDASKNILLLCENIWRTQQDGPIVTMDAGSNVHLLFRQDQNILAKQLQSDWSKHFKIIGSIV